MDKKKNIRVLHVDSEKTWRGGQQQAAYLLEGMQSAGYKTCMICQPQSALAKYCADKELPFHSVRMSGEIDFVAGYRIATICRKIGYNILHLHSAHSIATGLWAKLFHRRLKLIGVRRVDFHIRKNPFSHFKYSTRLINKLVCISKEIENVAKQDGIPENKLTVIYSGVDLNKFKAIILPKEFKQQIGIPDGHIVVGTVAALAWHKDYPNLLKAARIVLDRVENVTFCAVGSGPDKDKIYSVARELGLGNRFIFTGFRQDVGNFLKIYDMFVLSSCMEGLGTSILDAQVAGLPVIACKTGGIPEIVDHEINGLLVPSKNSEALAEAIIRLIKNKFEREKFGKKANEMVSHFSISNTIHKNLDLYRIILDSE